MGPSPAQPPAVPGASARPNPWRSPWRYIFGVIVAAYLAAFAAVIGIGAGFRTHDAPLPTPARVTLSFATPTTPPTPTTAPTATPIPPTVPPTATRPPNTPTPDPNVDFRVPLAASNTGVLQAQRVSILGITDEGKPSGTGTRAPTGMRFIAIDVLVENTGDQPVNLGRWQVHTATNTDVAAVAVTGFGDPLPATTPIAPRSIIKGVVVFAIPTNAKLTWIQYTPNTAFRGALYFDIA